jgi:hypothetical protein
MGLAGASPAGRIARCALAGPGPGPVPGPLAAAAVRPAGGIARRVSAEARILSIDPISGGCANPYAYAYAYAFGDPLDHPDLTGRGCGGPSWLDWLGIAL